MLAMPTKESQVEIEVLHRQGKSIREIARVTGLSRNTFRPVLRCEHNEPYGPRRHQLGPYQNICGPG